jgi:diaminopimelate epimerase
MNLPFDKYHGAGNDFILVDDRENIYRSLLTKERIYKLCHRHFGVGADGLILLGNHPNADFEMVYFNADGGLGSLCGNGSRCISAFANFLGLIGTNFRFIASDGNHYGKYNGNNSYSIKMNDVNSVKIIQPDKIFEINTGSPHYIEFVDDVDNINIVQEGKKIRYSVEYAKEGINVNFASIKNGELYIRTYERGVEDETLACGTGATATALAYYSIYKNNNDILLNALGGKLSINFGNNPDGSFSNIWLTGEAEYIFSGNTKF